MDLTIDELAARTGTKTSTIRMYQHQGLLPPPRVRGRVGYYGEGHVARLELIARLQVKGYSLAAIRDLTASWEAGGSVGALLGLEAAVAAPERGAEPVDLTYAEFSARFGGVEITPETLRRAVGLGLVELRDGGVHVADRRFLDVGAELVGLGIAPDVLLAEWTEVAAAATELARRFREVFEAAVWEPFVERGMPDADVAGVAGKLERMRALGAEVVQAAVQRAIAAETDVALDAQAARLGGSATAAGATSGRVG